MRRRNAAAAAAALAASGVLGASCSSSPEGGLAGKSASQIVSLAVTALHHQPSFHFVSRTKQGSTTETQIGDVGAKLAAESVAQGSKPVLDARLVGGVVYLQAGTDLLENVLGLSSSVASAHAGDWVAVHRTDSAYSDVASSLTATSAIELFVPEEPNLKVAGVTTVQGRKVVAVEGTSASTPTTAAVGKVTLFVSTTAPYLPVGGTVVVTDASGAIQEQDAVLFGRWGEKVHAVAPKGAAPLATLTAG